MNIEGYDRTDLKNGLNKIQTLDWMLSHSISSNFTFQDNDKIKTLLVTTGVINITVTLPTAADNLDRVIEIMKIDSGAGTVIIDGEGAETINGSTTKTLWSQYECITIKSNGTSWYILNWLPVIEWEYGRLTSNININGAWVSIGTIKTISKTGYYEMSANITFFNNQNAAGSINYVGLAFAINGTRRGASYQELSNIDAANEYISIPILNSGNLVVTDVITIMALSSDATILQSSTSTDYRSHWLLKRFPNNQIL